MATLPENTQSETPQSETLQPVTPVRREGITLRALIIGILLIPLMCLWVEYTEIVAQATDLAAMSLIIAVVFVLFVLLLFNFLLKKYLPRFAFSQAEVMYIYIMQTVSIGISGIGMMQFLNTFTGNIFYYGTPENQWKERFLPLVRSWLLPDERVTKAFYTGQSTFWRMDHIMGWMQPILVWTLFIVVLLWVMLCLNVLVRRQWMDQERLSFPITQLPLEIARDGGSGALFTNKMLWIGFLIPVVLESLASLNYLYPSIPFLPIKPSDARLNLTPFFAGSPPWNGLGNLQLSFYPLVIGLTYFLPLDVAFSLWFFYLFGKFENVLATGMGYHDPGASQAMSRLPYVGEQSAGAFLGVALFALYNMRKSLQKAFLSAFQFGRHRTDLHDANEPMPYRVAVLGAMGGYLFLILFGMAIGMSWIVPTVFYFLYYLYVITFTRIRAEAGLPWGFGPNMNVHDLMKAGVGSGAFNLQNTVGLHMILWHDLDMRTCDMPNQLEGMKIGEASRMNLRHVAAIIVLASVIGALASWGSVLTCYYQYGAATAKVNDWRTSMGSVPWRQMKDILDTPVKADLARLQGVGLGFIVTGALVVLRQKFVWWPFHPIGYAIAGTATMDWLWCATLMGWIIKSLVVRYGGMENYRQLIPFFIGLILGDYITGSVWAIYGSILGIQTYRAFPI